MASCECSVLWDGRQNFQVKWRGIGYCVNLEDGTCSCRVWELTGIPCLHAVSAIQHMRMNPIDFVSTYYSKAAYMRTYSHCLEVLRGEPFWEEVDGDTVLPPPIVKQLRGRPKRQRRREGWEGVSSSGKLSKLSRQGRVMHCTKCRKAGHNISCCPDLGKSKKKRSRKKKTTEEEDEVERREMEIETGEAELMEEALRNEGQPPTSPITPRRSQRLSQGTVDTQSTMDDTQPPTSVFVSTIII